MFPLVFVLDQQTVSYMEYYFIVLLSQQTSTGACEKIISNFMLRSIRIFVIFGPYI